MHLHGSSDWAVGRVLVAEGRKEPLPRVRGYRHLCLLVHHLLLGGGTVVKMCHPLIDKDAAIAHGGSEWSCQRTLLTFCILYVLSHPDQPFPPSTHRATWCGIYTGQEGTSRGPVDLLLAPFCATHCGTAPNLRAAVFQWLIKEEVEFDWGKLWWKEKIEAHGA